MGKNDDVEIETQEEWEELLAREGLVVIDVYQGINMKHSFSLYIKNICFANLAFLEWQNSTTEDLKA